MEHFTYIAYGSNLLTARLRQRIGDFAVLGVVKLEGWRIHYNKIGADGSGKCSLDSVPGETSWGVAYRFSATAKKVLDEIEGVGKGYDTANLCNEQFGQCYLYLAAPDHIDRNLAPYSWYQTLVVEGAKEYGLPDDYVSYLKGIQSVKDKNLARERANLKQLGRG